MRPLYVRDCASLVAWWRVEWKCLVEVSCVLRSAAQASQPAVVAREFGRPGLGTAVLRFRWSRIFLVKQVRTTQASCQ
jgi:hypothetical protein